MTTTSVQVLPTQLDLLALAAAHPERYPALLESVASGTAQARFDLLFGFPCASLQLDEDGCVRDHNNTVVGIDFLDALDAAAALTRINTPATDQLPFHGGWLLYLGYELAAQIERRLQLPPAQDGLPRALALRCPLAVIVDRAQACTYLVAEPGFEAELCQLRADIAALQPMPEQALPAATVEEDTPRSFLDGVARTLEYLRAGDVFQVNLSRQWHITLAEAAPPAQLYAALRRANPSPFAGFLQRQDWAVLSSSPERLVEIRGDRVQTRPIAGTRPRVAGDDDAARIRELCAHPKERAEHIMLIDLGRNDLGRVCRAGSIEVDEMMTVESYAHVHHLVSNVRGRLRDGVTAGEVIRAVFPGGTITGCPKVRCMEIIAELEAVGRGAYTGSFGYLDRHGDLDLNILIRTLTARGAGLSLRAGAGLVIDSDAEAELAETRAKARGMLRAFGCDG